MSETVDVLNELQSADLTQVSAVMPLIDDGVHEGEIIEIDTRENSKKTGHLLEMKIALTNPTPATKEGIPCEVNPGYPIFHSISLVRTEKYEPLEKIAELMQAALGTKEGSALPFEQFIGKTVTFRTKVELSDEWGDRARISRFLKQS